MKRNMDTIRRIAIATAELPYGETLGKLDGVPDEEFVTHVIWMQEADLIVADATDGSGSFAMYARVFRLTWDGCEFADAVLDDGLWKKAKDTVLKPGLSFTFDALRDWLKAEINQGLPTLRGLAG